MSQFRNLVFEGGGVRGVAYAGAIQVLEEHAILPDIQRVAGTSAGAIAATLLALGAPATEIREMWRDIDLSNLRDGTLGFGRLFRNYGWYKGNALHAWLQQLIKQYSGNPNLTFAELETLSNETNSGYKKLYVIGTNISKQRPEVFSAATTPTMKIANAVRISIGIPLYFQAIRRQGDLYVDGGVAWNYALDLFDKRNDFIDAPIPEQTSDQRRVINPETLGFRVADVDDVRLYRDGLSNEQEIKGLRSFLKVLIDYVWDMANNRHLNQHDWHRTIAIDADGISPTDFDISADIMNTLVANGRLAAERYVNWFHNPDNQPTNRIPT